MVCQKHSGFLPTDTIVTTRGYNKGNRFLFAYNGSAQDQSPRKNSWRTSSALSRDRMTRALRARPDLLRITSPLLIENTSISCFDNCRLIHALRRHAVPQRILVAAFDSLKKACLFGVRCIIGDQTHRTPAHGHATRAAIATSLMKKTKPSTARPPTCFDQKMHVPSPSSFYAVYRNGQSCC
ncbi:hypothetical protein EJB05_45047, partial [Eragrostis curvula]